MTDQGTPKEPTEDEKVLQATQEAMSLFLGFMGERQMDRRVAFLTMQMLVAYLALEMGMSLPELMNSIATNVPQFFRRWNETLSAALKAAKAEVKAAPVFDLEAFRKGKG